MGTHWEQQKIQHPHPPQKKKNMGSLGALLPHLIGCKKFICLHVFFAIFGQGYIHGTYHNFY
jgi:hypothetical protein